MLGVMAKMVHRPAEAARAAREQSGSTEKLRNSSETGEAQENPGEATERMCCRARVRAEMLYESPWR